jgi:TonB family protein
MNELIEYLLKVSAGTILLYLCFVLFFRRDTFYLRNRIILILAILLPLVIPLIEITRVSVTPEEIPIGITVINSAMTVGETFTGEVNSFDYNGLIIAFWLGIAALLMLRIIFGLMKTAAIIRKGTLKSEKLPKLIISDMDYPPFSFWPYAVIPRKIIDNGDAEDIITHENAHIRQGHTFDLIFSEIYSSFFWFNPVAWFLKKLIRLNHEFLADHELTRRSANIKIYQYKLLSIPEEYNRVQLAHSFNNLIKNRIVMINKKQTSDFATLKNLLIIPAVALIFAAFSCNNNPTGTKDSANSQATPEKLAEVPAPPPPINSQSAVNINDQLNGEEVFAIVDQMPEFPGGEKAMMQFIQNNLKYPESAQVTGVQGIVIVNFIVDQNGKIKNAKVMKGVPVLDAEALKVLDLMPNWQPGKMKGKPVSVSYTVPFKFVLN